MKPVKQENSFSCFQACVASILEVPWSSVPTFFDGHDWDTMKQQEWLLKEHKMQLLEIELGEEARLYPVATPIWCILTGQSPRSKERLHAIVAKFFQFDFEYIFDPHEDGTFIEGYPKCVGFLMKVEECSSDSFPSLD